MNLKLIFLMKFPPENTPGASNSITLIDLVDRTIKIYYLSGFLEGCKSEVKNKE